MKPPPFRYRAPSTVDEAVAALAEAGDTGKVLAGGQSLVPLLNMRLAGPQVLVDVNRVAGLDVVEVDDVSADARSRSPSPSSSDAAAAPRSSTPTSTSRTTMDRERSSKVGRQWPSGSTSTHSASS